MKVLLQYLFRRMDALQLTLSIFFFWQLSSIFIIKNWFLFIKTIYLNCSILTLDIFTRFIYFTGSIMDYKRAIKVGLYVLVNLSLFLFALFSIISSIIHYYTLPIYTSTHIIPQQESQFPDLTLCSLSGGYKHHVLKVRQF